jgi:hypothetical protein
MKLLKLTLENFRGAPDGAHSFAHPATGKPHDLTLITGGAASGKTSILEAIAAVKELVGGYGPPPDPARLRRSGTASGKIAATWLLTEAEAETAEVKGPAHTTEVSLADGPAPLFDPGVRSLFAAYAPEPSKGKVEFFPANRRISLLPAPPRRPASDFADARLRLSQDPGKYAGIRSVLLDLAIRDAMQAASRLATFGLVTRWEQPDAFAPIKSSLSALAPWLRLVGVRQDERSATVRFLRDNGAELELADLSEAEQQAVLFAVTFDRIGLSRSIVLIDQPELFLPPEKHAPWLQTIAGLGEGNQIIAATTSSNILEMVSAQQILRLGPKGR